MARFSGLTSGLITSHTARDEHFSTTYFLQALAITVTLLILVRHRSLVLRLQVALWFTGVTLLMLRSGVGMQLSFYSNDQQHYAAMLRILAFEEWPRDAFWWTEFSKFPYPLAALPLQLLGVHGTLALKSVSLVCLLILTQSLLNRYPNWHLKRQALTVFLTGCGLIGSFFSVLVLRETMMMLLVFRFTTSTAATGRVVSLALLGFLRPHLAAALLAAEIVVAIRDWTMRRRSVYAGEIALLLVIGVVVGDLLFHFRLGGFDDLKIPLSDDWGMLESNQFLSNYFGLQFMAQGEWNVRLSVSTLWLTRVIFSETVIIPMLFTFTCIFTSRHMSNRHRLAFITFAIYCSIVIRTEFNSFRQNIPLMPIMGMVVLDAISKHVESRASRTWQPESQGWDTRADSPVHLP